MKTTEYLYGIDPGELTGMNYVNAIGFKISSARLLLAELRMQANDSLGKEEEYRPVLERYLEVEKAIEFNNKLLRELEE